MLFMLLSALFTIVYLKMNLPKYYYITEKLSKLSYSATAGEQVAIERLIAGKRDFWVAPQNGEKKHRKTLVLSSWGYAFDEQEIKQLESALLYLLQDGFTIYYFIDSFPFTLDMADIGFAIKHASYTSSEPIEFINNYSGNHLRYEEVLLLDVVECLKLITNDFLTQPIHYSSKYELKGLSLRATFIDSNQESALVDITQYSFLNIDTFKKSMHADVEINRSHFYLNDLKNIRGIRLTTFNQDLLTLYTLLVYFPNLEKLYIPFREISVINEDELSPIRNNRLTTINIIIPNLLSIVPLMNASKGLKSIELSRPYKAFNQRLITPNEHAIKANSLHALEELSLQNFSKTELCQFLNQTLPHTKKLKKLTIEISENLDVADLSIEKFYLYEIEYLSVKTITYDLFIAIIKKCPKLRYLSISVRGRVSEAEMVGKVSLEHLLKLSINANTISSDTMNLFDNCSKLTFLNISARKIEHIEKINLPGLKSFELYFKKEKISLKDLYETVNTLAASATSITITYAQLVDNGDLFVEKEKNNTLKRITFKQTILPNSNLLNFLSCFTLLEKLILDTVRPEDATKLTEPYVCVHLPQPKLSLISLEITNVINSQIFIPGIITSSPLLSSLIFGGYEDDLCEEDDEESNEQKRKIRIDYPLFYQPAPKLKEIIMNHYVLNADVIANIEMYAIALEKAIFDECVILNFHFPNEGYKHGVFQYYSCCNQMRVWEDIDEPSQLEEETTVPFQLSSSISEQASITFADADTSFDTNTTYNLTKIFVSKVGEPTILPSQYRMALVEPTLNEQTCAIEEAFLLHPVIPKSTIQPSISRVDNIRYVFDEQESNTQYQFFLGAVTLLEVDGYQALPSIALGEQILFYQTSNHRPLDFKYSVDMGMYYVGSPTTAPCNETIEVHFILQVPRVLLIKNHALERVSEHLPAGDLVKLEDIQAELKSYTQGALTLTPPTASSSIGVNESELRGVDYLKAIMTEKKGACRHRAIVAYFLIKKQFPDLYPRVVNNQCHAYLEIKLDREWVKLDFGGYPAKLTIHEPNTLKNAAETIPTPEDALKQAQQRKQEEKIALISSLLLRHYSPPQQSLTLREATDTVLRNQYKKCLWQFNSKSALQSALICLRQQWLGPVFTIDSFDQLRCASPYIVSFDSSKARVQSGPGGKLYDFLTGCCAKEASLLLVNFDAFSIDEYISSNTLLDEKRLIEGIEVPETVVMIGLRQTHSPNNYYGSDFLSRLDVTLTLSGKDLPLMEVPSVTLTEEASVSAASEAKGSISSDDLIIEGYDLANWEQPLLGHWALEGDTLSWQTGVLQRALESCSYEPSRILFKNFPSDDSSFLLFVKRLQMLRQVQLGNQQLLFIPDKTRVALTQGYVLEASLQTIAISYEPPVVECFLLSQANYHTLFHCYHHDSESGYLTLTAGALVQAARQPFHIYVLETLTSGQWQKLADEANHYEVTVMVYLAPKVAHPYLRSEVSADLTATSRDVSAAISGYQIIISNEVDFLLESISYDYHLDVSALTKADLFDNLILRAERPVGQFLFDKQPSWLLKQLSDGKKVVLSGQVEPSLYQALMALFLAMEQGRYKVKGELLLLAEHERPYHGCQQLSRQIITPQVKRAALIARLQTVADRFTKDPLSKATVWLNELNDEALTSTRWITLKRSLNFILTFNMDAEDNWHGLGRIDTPHIGHLLPQLPGQMAETYLLAVRQAASAFIQQRNQAIQRALHHLPLVTLTGATGVGKSTHVQSELPKLGLKVYIGMKALKLFLTESVYEQKVLFLDEANLGDDCYAIFESMLNRHNPGVLYQGEFYPTTPQTHAVIFACNPQSYGGERVLPMLLQRHGNTVHFEPLSQAFLLTTVIRPLLASAHLPLRLQLEIGAIILSYYQHIVGWDSQHILISPRELAHVALNISRALIHNDNHYSAGTENLDESDDTLKSLCHYHCYHFFYQNLPLYLQSRFSKTFPEPMDHQAMLPYFNNGFTLVGTHFRCARVLHEALLLRQFRRYEPTLSNAERRRGMHGIVLEGNPGMGKSALIQAMLNAHQYMPYQLNDSASASAQVQNDGYLCIAANLALSQKLSLLKAAFEKGLVVIMEELNSSPLMEERLNAYLCGYDESGTVAPVPGFFLIASQNPTQLGGRFELTNALKRRLIQVQLPNHTESDLISLLQDKGLEGPLAKVFASGFLRAQNSDHSLTLRQLVDCIYKLGQLQNHYFNSFLSSSFFDEAPAVNDEVLGACFERCKELADRVIGLGSFPLKYNTTSVSQHTNNKSSLHSVRNSPYMLFGASSASTSSVPSLVGCKRKIEDEEESDMCFSKAMRR